MDSGELKRLKKELQRLKAKRLLRIENKEELSCLIRNIESQLLSPEYDFLEIDKRGFLKEGVLLMNAITVTKDKVQAAAQEYGINGDDGRTYMERANDIYERAGRSKVYSKRDIDSEKKRLIKYKKNKN